MLARENQHELCVAARKFRNLHVFGCWWFLNNPSIIEEITRMRLELIGLSMYSAAQRLPRARSARLQMEPLARQIIGEVLAEKYDDLAATGWEPTRAEIERDVRDLFGGAFETFTGRK